MPHCSETGCHRPVRCRGLCNAHYKKKRYYGLLPPSPQRAIEPPEDRFARKYEIDGNGCWIWIGATRNGYGIFSVRRSWFGYAHRWSYEYYTGRPIPSHCEIDHLCRNPRCVNPEHLEAVSHRTNVLRGESPAAVAARKTHCVHGHEFTPENTYIAPASGARYCVQCFRDRKARYAAGKVAA